MEDVERKICNFCINNKCKNCIVKRIKKGATTYKFKNYIRGEHKQMEYSEFIRYTYFDDDMKSVAIVTRETPKKIIEELKLKYDFVRNKEWE